MILADTSAVLAALDVDQRRHADVTGFLEATESDLVMSPFVAAELDFMLERRLGVDAELAFLGDVADEAYRLPPFDHADVARARRVIKQYRDLRIGLADASIVVLAERYDTTKVLTLDERHFRPLRPLQGGAFSVLPADA